jgi:hypothetical protein
MALIAIAADKGAPGVTTASIALGAVWPRPVLLAECDPAGADLVYRFPAADGGRLDPRRGLLSLAVAARRGLQPHQVWEHSQKLHGGLDILAGVSGAEQGVGLDLLWGPVGRVLAGVPQADVIADCGRLGLDSPIYDLLTHASTVVLLSRATLGEVVRLRDRVNALTGALQRRGRSSVRIDVVVVADHKKITSAIEEVGHALRQSGAQARIIGGLAHEPRSAEQLRGEWGGKLDKSMFMRTVRAVASYLVTSLPESAAAPESPADSEGPRVSRSQQPSYQLPAAGSRPQQPVAAGDAHPYSLAPQQQLAAASPQPYSAPVWPSDQFGKTGPPSSEPAPWRPGSASVPAQPSEPGPPGVRGRHAGWAATPSTPQTRSEPERGDEQPEPSAGTPQNRPGGGE